MSNNLHAKRWTDDPVQQAQFFNAVGPKIHVESKYVGTRYGVGMYLEDIESGVKAKLWRQMLEVVPDGPFDEDTPEDAAGCFLEKENYRIRELARPIARKIANEHKKLAGQAKKADKRKKQSEQAEKPDEHEKQAGQADDSVNICWPKTGSRQADELAKVRQPDLPPDVENDLFAIAKCLPIIVSKTLGITPRESEVLCLETLRVSHVDDLPESTIYQVARAAGITGPKQLEFNKYHDENGHLSPSDRKALSRARAKVAKALTRAALTSLLAITFALSLALLNAIHQGRSDHQNALVHQGNLIDEVALAHQDTFSDEIARNHQDNLSGEVAYAHQGKLGDKIARTHQRKLLNEVTSTHQSNLI
jgi:hypothetical protein